MKYICLYNQELTSDSYGVSSRKYNNAVCTVFSKLKSNKGGGTDNILPELITKKGRRGNFETGTI
jgi:hypothetical protein